MNITNPYAGNRHWSNDRAQLQEHDYLGPLGIEIIDADGAAVFDPNSLVGAVFGGLKGRLKPLPDVASVCSGAPAVKYRTSEIELALTPDEVVRLTTRALTPDEFTKICDAVGAIYELHDDFYDPDTGEALQPRYVDGDEPSGLQV